MRFDRHVVTKMTAVLVMAAALLTAVGAAVANDAALCLDMAEKKQWSRAVPSCKAAAERGSIMPQFALGTMYERGQGVAQDYK
jgi:TPR repeat protein